jgi:hypothetical protein
MTREDIEKKMHEAAEEIKPLVTTLVEALCEAHQKGYLAGVELGAKMAYHQWIPVEKELPKEKQKVLVYMPADERCDHEYMCEALYNYAWHKWEDADEPIELEGITHWTEIMPPRKEE